MIGGWDNTNAELVIMPSALADGGFADKFTGNIPTYRAVGTPFTATFVNFVSGEGYVQAEKAVLYDGVNTHLDTNFRPTRDNSSGEAVELWFYTTDTSQFCDIFSQRLDTNNIYMVRLASGNIEMFYRLAGAIRRVSVSASGLANQWNHIVFIKDGGTLSIVLNGSEPTYVTRDTYNLGSMSLALDVTIGSDFSNSFPFDGRHDDLIYYNRALSIAEAQTNYGLGRGKGLIGSVAGDVMSLSNSSIDVIDAESITLSAFNYDASITANSRGHIGAFYFGSDNSFSVGGGSLELNIHSPIVDEGFVESLGDSSHIYINNYTPNIITTTGFSIDFSASPVFGNSPLTVDFKAIPKFTFPFAYNNYITEFRWYFDYGENPLEFSAVSNNSSKSVNTTHTYEGDSGRFFDVRLCVDVYNVVTDETTEFCTTKENFIKISDIVTRFSDDKYIDIVSYLPDFLKSTQTKDFLQFFEDYLNQMYDDDNGFSLSLSASGEATISADGEATNIVEKDVQRAVSPQRNDKKISIIEKINRLTDLHDPDIIDEDYLEFFASYLGYDINVNRGEFGILPTSASEIELNRKSESLRFMVRNLPNWYKIKTTRSAIKILLFSFGLIGDIVYHYTDSYESSSMGGKWLESDIVYNFDLNKMVEDISFIPDEYFPTSHFSVYYDINRSSLNFGFNRDKQDQILRAVESIRPANTVFRGATGRFTDVKDINVRALQGKVTKFISVKSDLPADNWNV